MPMIRMRSVIVVIGFFALASLVLPNSTLNNVVFADDSGGGDSHPSQLSGGGGGGSDNNGGGSNNDDNSHPQQLSEPNNNDHHKNGTNKPCKPGKHRDPSTNKCVKDQPTTPATPTAPTATQPNPLSGAAPTNAAPVNNAPAPPLGIGTGTQPNSPVGAADAAEGAPLGIGGNVDMLTGMS